MQFFFQIVI